MRNLYRLYFIKFLPKLDHSCLVMEDGTRKLTPPYT